MASLHLAAGDQLTLWVQDRATLTGLNPVGELQKGLASLGFKCELRGLARLLPFEIVLAAENEPPKSIRREPLPSSADAFRIVCDGTSIRLRAQSQRGFAYAAWELMESFGWSWPTPQITREPEASSWTFEEDRKVYQPALENRILFAEQVDLTPAMMLWFSRLRFNTLFPSNPSRFTEPESQFPAQSLAMASSLGFELIVGGDCWPWISAGMDVEEPSSWESLSPNRIAEAVDTVHAYWQEMDKPKPRFSVWPMGCSRDPVAAFVAAVLEKFPDLLLETAIQVPVAESKRDRVLFQIRDDTLSPQADEESIRNWMEYWLGETNRKGIYLFSNPNDWDDRLGGAVAPLLWRRLHRRIAIAHQLGLEGAAIGLTRLDSFAFLERAGFAYSVFARAMWNGADWDPEAFVERAFHDQFEGAGAVVNALARDLERWVSEPGSDEEALSNAQSFFFRFAHQVLPREQERDRLDQRVSEIEESAPCETCIEFSRSLATLVSLFDLEECGDPHEAKAIARTIWKRNMMDSWPEWLQVSSPLADRLKTYL